MSSVVHWHCFILLSVLRPTLFRTESPILVRIQFQAKPPQPTCFQIYPDFFLVLEAASINVLGTGPFLRNMWVVDTNDACVKLLLVAHAYERQQRENKEDTGYRI